MLGSLLYLTIYHLKGAQSRRLAEKFRRSERLVLRYFLAVIVLAFLPIPARYALPLLALITGIMFYLTYRIQLEELGIKG